MRPIISINPIPNPVHLIEYGDFSCLRCQELQKLLVTILPLFGRTVRYTFRHFPDPNHPLAFLMAIAAEAARRQDKYGAMHQALFSHPEVVSLDSLLRLATGVGLKRETFLTDIHDERLKERIWNDIRLGRLVQVVATPTLFLGIHRLHGKLTQARLVPLIRNYIDRSNADAVKTIDRENRLVRWS